MKSLRSILILLLSVTTGLMLAQSAAAMGGKGPGAAVVIGSVLLINPNVPADKFITAEIVGGGFLGGNFVEVTLDGGNPLALGDVSETMLIAKIPKKTPDGDYTLTVRTGDQSKQTASTTIGLGGEMIVSCISWFRSGPADEHVHTEIHVEDENGDAVIGAIVTWTSENDTVGVYQTNTSATRDVDGHAKELLTCPGEVSGSGVTDWFCCIGAGDFDGDIPGKRACDPGLYTSVILNVAAPPQTNMVWNERASELEAEITLEPKPQ
jgi:hypothetical protein